jgi:hypothetical protein
MVQCKSSSTSGFKSILGLLSLTVSALLAKFASSGSVTVGVDFSAKYDVCFFACVTAPLTPAGCAAQPP